MCGWADRCARLRAAALATAFGSVLALVLVQPASATAGGATATGRPATGRPATTGGAGGWSPEPDASTKYYIVQPPADGQRENLYGIAVRTLGDGNRYREIYELNEDRPQPDGGQLTDPLELRPGWLLVLPADATGPDVRIGPMPGRTPTESARAAPPGDSSETGFFGYLLRIGALGLMAILLGAVFRVLRRDRAATVPGRPPAPPRAPEPRAPEPRTSKPQIPEPVAPVLRADNLGGLRATVRNGDDQLAVRLLGAEKTQYAYTSLDSLDSLRGAGLRLVLGRSEHGVLRVDLACIPDVLTISGPLDACRRQALALARQARGAGMGVTVVGEAIGRDEAPAGCRWAASFPEPEELSDLRREGTSSLVISLGLRGAQLRSARHLMARTDRLAVPVIIGEVLRARWSVEVTPGDGQS